MSKYLGLFLMGMVLLTFSCKTHKKAVVVEKPKAIEIPKENLSLLKAIEASENTIDYYYARGSAQYKDPEQNIDLGVELIMEKDRYVYMNVTALLGIAVARVWITNDSICIMDILHKKNIVTNYNYLKSMSNVELNLHQIQQIFLGNTIFTADPMKMTVDTVLNYILINTPLKNQQVETTYYNNASFKVTRSIIKDQISQREMRAEYTEGYTKGANNYPKAFNINIRAEKNMECRFNLDYFAFDKKKETKFVVPKSFETIRK